MNQPLNVAVLIVAIVIVYSAHPVWSSKEQEGVTQAPTTTTSPPNHEKIAKQDQQNSPHQTLFSKDEMGQWSDLLNKEMMHKYEPWRSLLLQADTRGIEEELQTIKDNVKSYVDGADSKSASQDDNHASDKTTSPNDNNNVKDANTVTQNLKMSANAFEAHELVSKMDRETALSITANCLEAFKEKKSAGIDTLSHLFDRFDQNAYTKWLSVLKDPITLMAASLEYSRCVFNNMAYKLFYLSAKYGNVLPYIEAGIFDPSTSTNDISE